MTENEVIEELKYDCNELGKAIPCDTSWGKSFENAYAMAIKALEEVQQYRQIGTVSTCRNAVEICRAMIERGIEMDNIKEYIKFEDNLVQRGYDLKRFLEMMEEHNQYREIGTPEECRAAVEKQTAKKAITYRGTNRADCPACGATVRGIDAPFGNWCSKCGQRLDWEDEE